MTDKQILAEVYRRLQDYCSSFRREGHLGVNRYDIKEFIEEEWQKVDELDDHPLTKSDEGQMYNINSIDAAEIERHVGLEIGEDGTVTGIK